jgi:hypothetical protein
MSDLVKYKLPSSLVEKYLLKASHYGLIPVFIFHPGFPILKADVFRHHSIILRNAVCNIIKLYRRYDVCVWAWTEEKGLGGSSKALSIWKVYCMGIGWN